MNNNNVKKLYDFYWETMIEHDNAGILCSSFIICDGQIDSKLKRDNDYLTGVLFSSLNVRKDLIAKNLSKLYSSDFFYDYENFILQFKNAFKNDLDSAQLEEEISKIRDTCVFIENNKNLQLYQHINCYDSIEAHFFDCMYRNGLREGLYGVDTVRWIIDQLVLSALNGSFQYSETDGDYSLLKFLVSYNFYNFLVYTVYQLKNELQRKISDLKAEVYEMQSRLEDLKTKIGNAKAKNLVTMISNKHMNKQHHFVRESDHKTVSIFSYPLGKEDIDEIAKIKNQFGVNVFDSYKESFFFTSARNPEFIVEKKNIIFSKENGKVVRNTEKDILDFQKGWGYERRIAKAIASKCPFWCVTQTYGSHDFGCDICIENTNNKKAVLQLKEYKGSVGLNSVQEIVASAKMYDSNMTAVVTNSHFTSGARKLAYKNDCALFDNVSENQLYRLDKLIEMISAL